MRGSGFLKGVALGAAVSTVVVAATAAVAGNGVGGVFNLGQGNTVDQTTALSGAPVGKPSLKLTNSSTAAGATALSLNVASGLPPFSVNSNTKVAKLNADKLDGFDSTGFLPNQVPLSLSGSTATGAIVSASNSGNANGFQGTSNAGLASGVYGENTGGGYGVGGRTNSFNRGALFGENLGAGPALELHNPGGGPPISVDSTAKVYNLNADQLDGLDSTAFARSDSSAFVHGNGHTYTAAASLAFGETRFDAVAPGFFRLKFICTTSDYDENIVLAYNDTGDPLNIFSEYEAEPGYRNVNYRQVAAGAVTSFTTVLDGDIKHLFIQGTPGGVQTVANLDVGSARRASDCHFQVQALVTQ
jgi:hypothetical protein